MPYLARSASNDHAPQLYREHVLNVLDRGRCFLRQALHYARGLNNPLFIRIFELAAEYHDLGKLDNANQDTLAGNRKSAHLPLDHTDAGTAHLRMLGERRLSDTAWLAAFLVYAHHRGLPDLSDVESQDQPLRNLSPYKRGTVAEWVDKTLPDLLSRHREALSATAGEVDSPPMTHALTAADSRILFACLTHADHGDAAHATGEEQPPSSPPPELRPVERLEALTRYVNTLPKDGGDRTRLRANFFASCAGGASDASGDSIVICDAPVGTGKTTAVMAHLLRVAARQGLRRVFIILPFTNIITQSVSVYRKALTLDGENANDVVAEIHHRADFNDIRSRKLTALWDAPIVVTTAVAFFETLASARPSTLRRLQNLPGSAVFLDEAHAMLPVKLLPLAWRWMRYMAEVWSCYWALASGSLSRFWELEEFQNDREIQPLANMLPVPQQEELIDFEKQRVTHRFSGSPMTLDEFVAWTATLEGPVIVVLNTVHTAAAAARKAESVFGTGNVLHLSTSLAPKDREITLNLVKARLRYKGHSRWCLFATSCVEAGVDLSFRTGVRECASLLSLLQLSGRVNRNAEYDDADVWTISLNTDNKFVNKHPAFDCSSRILKEFFESGKPISPVLCTDAMRRELRETSAELKYLLNKEGACAFETIECKFKVIPDDTLLAIVDKSLIKRIQKGKDTSWRDIQDNSVHIRKNIIARMAIPESRYYPGLFLWNAPYTAFLGYMEGVLQLVDFDSAGGAIL